MGDDDAAGGQVRHTTVRTDDGATLAVQTQGPEGAPALLLLPGQANSHRWWDGLRDPFAETFRTITFDYRGTGASRPAGDAWEDWATWSTAVFAADAVAVLSGLGLEHAHVYGTSMGGRIGQVLALDHRTAVDRLVLACTSPGRPGGHERDRDVRRRLGQPDAAARTAALVDLMYTPAYGARRGRASTLLGDPTMSADASRGHLRVSGRHAAFDRLGEISTPTLVLHGTDDLMSPVANAHLIGERVPGAHVHLTGGGRHGFFEEFADQVDAEVLAFLS